MDRTEELKNNLYLFMLQGLEKVYGEAHEVDWFVGRILKLLSDSGLGFSEKLVLPDITKWTDKYWESYHPSPRFAARETIQDILKVNPNGGHKPLEVK